MPHLPIASAKTSHILSSDPEVIQDRKRDPLVHRGSVPVRTGAEMLRAADHACETLETITLPLFIMHGAADTLVSPNGSRLLYERAQSADKTLQIYDGLYHEPLNEPQPHRDRVMDDILSWLDAHAG